jgi:Tfp pilus assembly protein PilO
VIRINVAPEIKYKSNSAELVRILAVVLVCCGIGYYVPVYYADLKNTEAQEIQARIEEKKGQLQKLKVDVEKVKSLQARLGELKSRADRIRSLSSGRKQPVLLLDTLQNQHLERMWFTGVGVNGNDVHLQGFALDHSIIAEYVRRLKINIGAQAEGDAGDLKDFVPPFMQGDSVKDDVQRTESVMPIKISDVLLNKSTADTKENVLVQSFDIKFNANIR